MFEKVIVGVDDAGDAAEAIAFARSLAPTAELLLASVYGYDDIRGEAALPGYDEVARTERAAALTTLQETLPGVETHVVVARGISPGKGLRTLAAERGADLVVVGSARHAGIGRLGLGDVSRGVLRGTTCPVAVVPKGSRPHLPPRTIGVAFDRSSSANAALATATQLASSIGATLVLTAAIEANSVPVVGGSQFATAIEDLRVGVETRLREIAADLPVPAAAHAQVGTARDVLAHLAANSDLLVTGSRGWGPWARVTLGSTSDWLIHHVGCPVMVVPRPADESVEHASARSSSTPHEVTS